jgi:hypothetical protein
VSPRRKRVDISVTDSQQASSPRFAGVEDAPIVYANTMQMKVSKNDFRIVFGDVTSDDATKARARVMIYMTPLFAKAAARVLQVAVEEFEKQHEKITGLAGTSSNVPKQHS